MSSRTPTQLVQLSTFGAAEFAAPARHPEAAGSPCQCSAPEPCWSHDPATTPMPAVAPPPADDTGPTPAGRAPTRCQCSAPAPCTEHPEERPWRQIQPAWNDAHPDSPVGRTRRRLAADRAAGVLPGAEPGQGAEVLRFLTDVELGAWTQALLTEHHRRQARFADYRAGVRSQLSPAPREDSTR